MPLPRGVESPTFDDMTIESKMVGGATTKCLFQIRDWFLEVLLVIHEAL